MLSLAILQVDALALVMVEGREAGDPWVIWAQLSAQCQNRPPARRPDPGPVLGLKENKRWNVGVAVGWKRSPAKQ